MANAAIRERVMRFRIDLSEQPCRDSMFAESRSPAFLVLRCGKAVTATPQTVNYRSAALT